MTIKDDNFHTNPMFTSPEEVKVVDPPARDGLPQVAIDPSPTPASKDFSWSSYKGQLDWLPRRTIYLTRHGSHAYGTSLPTSDLDIRGVAIAPMRYYTGFLDRFEQAESKDPDLVVFELRKFFSLAADANPNALEILFTRPEDHLRVTPFGDRLLSIRRMFLSRRVKHTLSGYAISQLKRINTHYRWLKSPPKAPPTREEFGLPERTLIPQDQLAAAHAAVDKQLAVWNFTGLDSVDPATRIALQNSMAELLAEIKVSADALPTAAARAIGYDENFIELLDRERHYTGRKREWDNYQTWKKTRNATRAELEAKFGMDTKHAMHLVRLMRVCREVLTTGEYNVYRLDAEELLAIRAGSMTHEGLNLFAEAEDKALTELMKTCTFLPKEPDRKRLDELCAGLIEEFNVEIMRGR